MSELTLENFPRKFNIGDQVRTKSGLVGEVIGSALYGTDGEKPTKHTWVEYRIKIPGKNRTLYRRESELEHTDQVLVVFRKYRDVEPPFYGDIVALFPELPGSPPYTLCYQHVGQHGDANYSYMISITDPATPDEYNDLRVELESIGYHLKIRRKWIRRKWIRGRN